MSKNNKKQIGIRETKPVNEGVLSENKYEITIIEKYKKRVPIKAATYYEAVRQIKEQYLNGDIVLGEEDRYEYMVR